MAISRRIQDLLAKSDFDNLEGDWLAHQSAEPGDLGFFVGVARALVGHGEEERARFLLELYDEQLREAGRWQERLRLLEQAGAILLPEPEALHGEILATLKSLHGGHSAFAGLVEATGLERAPHDIPKTWTKVARFLGLAAFDVGEVVWMEGKGAGRITEVNLGLDSFRIDFEHAPRLAVGFRAAAKVLERLEPEHVLRRKLEQPEALRKLAAEDPPELLHAVLTSYRRPLTAAEIRRALEGIVDADGWNTWWATARKHPQVVSKGSGRQSYDWAESSADAVDSVWQAFTRAAPRKKIDLLRRHGGRDPALRQRMEDALTELGEGAVASDPGLAAEIWYALDKQGAPATDLPFAPAALLASVDPQRLLAGMEDRALRERFYLLIRQQREDWPQLYLTALAREEDPRSLTLLAEGLEQSAPAELDRFIDGVVNQPHKTPAAFTWIAERAAQDPQLVERNPLRLLQQILAAPARDELAPYRSRLLAQCDSGGAVPRLLGRLSEEQGASAVEAVQRAAGIEPFRREDLVRALELRFPSLRRQPTLALLHALPSSIAAKQAELDEILKREIPVNRKAIEEARAMGDLRENFEYKSARQRHEYLTARASELKEQLQRAQPIDLAAVDAAEVRVGTRVTLADGAGVDREITVLGPWESAPEAGVVSYESDLGQQLLGKQAGDQVTTGDERLTVTAIAPYEA